MSRALLADMTLSGTHEITAPRWTGQATSAIPQTRLLAFLAAPVILIAFLLFGQRWFRRAGGGLPEGFHTGVSIAIALTVVALLAWFVVGRLRYRNPIVDFYRGQLRIGSDETPFVLIDRAWIIRAEQRSRSDHYLFVQAKGHLAARVVLHSSKGAVLGTEQREVIAELLRRSSIAVPGVNESRLERRQHLTRDDAIAIVLTPGATLGAR